MLPVSGHERLWFAVLSVSAGVCEELIYRGFLLEYFRGRLNGPLHLNLTAAWLLTSVAFGTAHLYQGLKGILSTTIAWLALGMLAILSGSLALPMLLHALVDLQVLVMYRPGKDSPEEAQRLVSGCALEPGLVRPSQV